MGITITHNAPKIKVSFKAWEKITLYTDLMSTEHTCFGTVKKTVSDKGLVTLLLEDVFFVEQANGGASTEVEGEAMNKLLYELSKTDEDDKLRCWIHSHAGMDTFWSSTDEAQIKDYSKWPDFWLSIVVNKARKWKVRLEVLDTKSEILGLSKVTLDDLPWELDSSTSQYCGECKKNIEELSSNASQRFKYGKLPHETWGRRDKERGEFHYSYHGGRHNNATRHNNGFDWLDAYDSLGSGLGKEQPKKVSGLKRLHEQEDNPRIELGGVDEIDDAEYYGLDEVDDDYDEANLHSLRQMLDTWASGKDAEFGGLTHAEAEMLASELEDFIQDEIWAISPHKNLETWELLEEALPGASEFLYRYEDTYLDNLFYSEEYAAHLKEISKEGTL